MNRWKQASLAAAVVGLAGVLAYVYRGADHATGAGKPNIILIVTDDQDIDSVQYMPNTINALARGGVSFSSAFVASPFCAPSRASILRGQYLQHHNAMTGAEFLNRRLDSATMATVLKGAGYHTALVGKYLGIGAGESKPPGWDEWYTMLTHNVYFDYWMNENGKKIQYGTKDQDYISSVLTARALDFIGRARKGEPFFLYVGTVAPHAPSTAPPGHEADFADVEKRPSIEEDISDKPDWVRQFRTRNPTRLDEGPEGTERAADRYRKRLRALLSVDGMVGDLVRALADRGLADRTFIFFVSDNSDWVSKHYPGSPKLSPYDDGIHVPLFVAGPEVEAGGQRTEVVSSVDLLPTFAQLAGVAAPEFADGRSLVPLFGASRQNGQEWREVVLVGLGEITEWPWASYPPPYSLMRSATFKYIEYTTGEREYYDLRSDPEEMDNAFGRLTEDERAALARRLHEKITAGR